MCELTSVFEVRSGMVNEPSDGIFEGGMFSSFEQAKEFAEKLTEKSSDDYQWLTDSHAESRFYYIKINEHDIIYPGQR